MMVADEGSPFPYNGRKIGEFYGYCGPCMDAGPEVYVKILRVSLEHDDLVYVRCDDCKVVGMTSINPKVGRQIKVYAKEDWIKKWEKGKALQDTKQDD